MTKSKIDSDNNIDNKSNKSPSNSSDDYVDCDQVIDTSSDGVLNNSTDSTLEDMPITTHLVELRSRLIKVLVVILIIFIGLVGYSRELYDLFSNPLVALLPSNSSMIATDVTTPFMAPLRLALFTATFLGMPYILYQLWAFIAPALYAKEKKIAIPILLASIVLFYSGVAFAYFVVLAGVLKFFIIFSPENVLPMTDIDSYLGFAIQLFLVFGSTFEIPIITLVLILAGIVSIKSLEEKRRYVIVGCFAVSAIVTPPDGLSMLLLAIPMWLLFEMGLLMAKVLIKEPRKKS